MLDLLRTIRCNVEQYVIGIQKLTEDAAIGDTTIFVGSSRRFVLDQQVAIYDQPTDDSESIAQIRSVETIPDPFSLTLDQPLTETVSAAAGAVQKTFAGTFITAVFLGEPPVIPRFPAITVRYVEKNNDMLTIGGTVDEVHSIQISVHAGGPNYQQQYEAMLYWSRQIETASFANINPIISPFDSIPLAEDVDPEDTIIRLSGNLSNAQGMTIYLESAENLAVNRIEEDLGNRVYQLIRAVGKGFDAGTSNLIRPTRAAYLSRPTGITFETNPNSIAIARVNVEVKEAVARHVNNAFPTTF